MKNINRKSVVIGATLSLALAFTTHAIPTIKISDGVNTVIVQDNIGADGSAIAGFVSYVAPAGTFAGWSVILTAGTTKPLIGSATAPELDLNWQIVRQGPGSGTLTVCFSENGFNLSSARTSITAAGGALGTSGNTALVRTYYDTGNTELATTSLLSSHNFSGPGAFAANDAGNVPADASIAFTVKLDLNQGVGQVTSGDIHLTVSVPEAGSMLTLLGTALLALGAFAVRRRS